MENLYRLNIAKQQENGAVITWHILGLDPFLGELTDPLSGAGQFLWILPRHAHS